MLSHESITVNQFGGRFNRGNDDVVPLSHALTEQNNRFTHDGIETREGSSLSITLANILRVHLYRKVGAADRFLILTTGGTIFDSAVSIVVPILTVATMTDFSCHVMFDRAYITPHDGNKGITAESLYVYTGSGVARAAAGAVPAGGGGFAAAASAGAGIVDKGNYVITVVYETDTGFITSAENNFILYAAPATKKIDLTNIPIGPAYVSARRILISKVFQKAYSGNTDDYKMYFAPNGRIGDNTATTLTLNFYSNDLLDSAEYLFDQLATIPAFLGLAEYSGRLVGWSETPSVPSGGGGGLGTASTANIPYGLVRISKSGHPESFSTVDGYVLPPVDGGYTRACVAYRGNLNIHKSQRAYSTTDNGKTPAEWDVIDLDRGKGTEVHGISKVLDTYGNTMDIYLIADRQGLLKFNGNFAGDPLTWKIQDDWDRINQANFHKLQILLDPINKYIYVNAPLDSSTTCNYVFVGDYKNGLDPQNIRWSIWAFPINPVAILLSIDFTTKAAKFYFGSTNIYVLVAPTLPNLRNDFGNAIDSYYETSLVPRDSGGHRHHYAGLRIRAIGTGTLNITVRGEDSVETLTPTTITLSETPGKEFESKFNFKSTRAAFKFRVNSSPFDYYKINTIRIYINKLWRSFPG